MQKAGGSDDLGGGICHHQPHRVPRDPGGAGENALRISDGVHLHHIIHPILGNGPVRQGIGEKGIGEDDNFFGIHGVRYGITQTAAGGGAQLSRGVSPAVGRRNRYKSDIDGSTACGDVRCPRSVRAKFHRL